MSWYSDPWTQDDSVLGGLPYTVAPPDPYSINGVKTVWHWSPSILGGLPYTEWIAAPEMPVDIMPYIVPPIIVFSPKATSFEGNGERILSPTSAEYELTLGQAGEVEIVHPIDDEGDWQTLKGNVILKCPIRRRGQLWWQPFRIYRVQTEQTRDGTMQVKAYARHLWYDLNESILLDVRPTNLAGQDAIQWIMDRHFNADFTDDPVYRYSYYSDITAENSAEYQGVSLGSALIGADNSIANRWGGELFVDGYYFSICKQLEGSLQNAFEIRYSVDLMDVTEDIDYTQYCTYLIVSDNFGQGWTISTEQSEMHAPLPHVRFVRMSYDVPDMVRLMADGGALWAEMSVPKASYSVNFAPLHRLPEYGDFAGLRDKEVGDGGTIISEPAGIRTTQRVVKKRVDLLHDVCLKIELGGVKSSITAKPRWSDTARTGPASALEKQIQAQDAQNIRTWGDATAFRWAQLTIYTWQQIGG